MSIHKRNARSRNYRISSSAAAILAAAASWECLLITVGGFDTPVTTWITATVAETARLAVTLPTGTTAGLREKKNFDLLSRSCVLTVRR